MKWRTREANIFKFRNLLQLFTYSARIQARTNCQHLCRKLYITVMEPQRARYVKLNGLPYITKRPNDSPRIIDATSKPAQRQSHYTAKKTLTTTNSNGQSNHITFAQRHNSPSPNFNPMVTTSAATQTSFYSNQATHPPSQIYQPRYQPTVVNARSSPNAPQAARRLTPVTPVNPAPSPVCSDQCLSDTVKRLEGDIHVITEQLNLILRKMGKMEKVSEILASTQVNTATCHTSNNIPSADFAEQPHQRYNPTTQVPSNHHGFIETSPRYVHTRVPPSFQATNARMSPTHFYTQRTVTPPCQLPIRTSPKHQQNRPLYRFENSVPENPEDFEMSFDSQEYISRHKLNSL